MGKSNASQYANFGWLRAVIFYNNRIVCLLKAYETDEKHEANFIT